MFFAERIDKMNNKKTLNKSKQGYFLPVMCILMTAVCAALSPSSIHFNYINIDISRMLFIIIYAAFCTAFLLVTGKSSVTFLDEIIKAVIVAEMFPTLRFSQKNIIIPILVVIMFFSVYAAMFDEAVKVNKANKKELTEKQKSLFRVPACRMTCLIMSFVMLATSIMGIASGVFKGSGENIINSVSVCFASETDESEESEYPEIPKDMAKKMREWDKLDNYSKADLNKAILRIECERLGLNEMEITYKEIDPPVAAYYSNSEKKIVICNKVLDDNLYININVVCHECFHAYQHYIVEHTDFSSKLVQNSYYYRQARIWKNSIEKYISVEENEVLYREQPLEADAYAYGDGRESAYKYEISTMK